MTNPTVTLVHPEQTLTVPSVQAKAKLTLFQKNPALLISPYRLQSPVSLRTFREFLSELQGTPITVSDKNFPDLLRLSEEFGFSDLSVKLSEFRPVSPDARFACLFAKCDQHGRAIASLQAEFAQVSTDLGRLTSEVSALRSTCAGLRGLPGELSILKTQVSAGLGDHIVAQLSTEISDLRKDLSVLKKQIAAMPPDSPPPAATTSAASRQPPPSSMPSRFANAGPPSSAIAPSSLNSRIIADFPDIFEEFRWRRLSLLWRGSRDGFRAKEFHRRCDGHANTLTVILDTNGNVFGGFTPVKWESRHSIQGGDNCLKADESQKSFLFSITNPWNMQPMKFPVKPEKKKEAIVCNSVKGPAFGDIEVADNCNQNTESYTSLFGDVYTNDTGVDGETFFTASYDFQVKEIEVFEITD